MEVWCSQGMRWRKGAGGVVLGDGRQVRHSRVPLKNSDRAGHRIFCSEYNSRTQIPMKGQCRAGKLFSFKATQMSDRHTSSLSLELVPTDRSSLIEAHQKLTFQTTLVCVGGNGGRRFALRTRSSAASWSDLSLDSGCLLFSIEDKRLARNGAYRKW